MRSRGSERGVRSARNSYDELSGDSTRHSPCESGGLYVQDFAPPAVLSVFIEERRAGDICRRGIWKVDRKRHNAALRTQHGMCAVDRRRASPSVPHRGDVYVCRDDFRRTAEKLYFGDCLALGRNKRSAAEHCVRTRFARSRACHCVCAAESQALLFYEGFPLLRLAEEIRACRKIENHVHAFAGHQ